LSITSKSDRKTAQHELSFISLTTLSQVQKLCKRREHVLRDRNVNRKLAGTWLLFLFLGTDVHENRVNTNDPYSGN